MSRSSLARGYVATQWATTVHKLWVAYFMVRLAFALPGLRKVAWFRRALTHDLSKYRWDEAKGFAQTIFDLRTTDYGTSEYRALLRQIKPSIDLHYRRNSHHPEHYVAKAEQVRLLGEPKIQPYRMMSFMDRAEMLCDWCAAVKRHDSGDLAQSIEHNAKRFGYSEIEAVLLTTWAKQVGAL